MNLRRALFLITVGLFVAGVLAVAVIVIGVAVGVAFDRPVDLQVPAYVLVVVFPLRLILALWLKKLGGPPLEFWAK